MKILLEKIPKKVLFSVAILAASFALMVVFLNWHDTSAIYTNVGRSSGEEQNNVSSDPDDSSVAEKEIEKDPRPVITHIKTPETVRGIYMTSWVAGTPSIRERVISYIESKEDLNSVVIDIKDDTGKISFPVFDENLKKFGTDERRIADLPALIEKLHEKDIYVIGRVAVFQDPYLAKAKPEWAVLRESDGGVWEDRKGLSWLDAGNREVWDYAISIAREAYAQGFDEIQFDYIRFPSDGNTQDIYYPHFSNKTKKIEVTEYETVGTTTVAVTKEKIVSLEKFDQIKEFFDYVGEKLLGEIPISADLFGYTTTNRDDLGIGQIIEHAAPNFDFISPMVYPSHYNDGAFGYADPNEVPYEIIYRSMVSARDRLMVIGEDPKKLRPWLQDFDYPVPYDTEDVRAQIRATYDAGLDSWLLWDPSNKYTLDVLPLPETEVSVSVNETSTTSSESLE